MGHRFAGCVLAASLAVATAWAGGCGGGSSGGKAAPGGRDSGIADATNTHSFADAPAAALSIQPVNGTLTTMGAGGTQQFSAYLGTSQVQPTWSIISGVTIGSIDASGLFTAGGLIGGTVGVQAQLGMLTAQAQLHVVLELQDNPGNVPPNVQGQLQAGTLDGGGTSVDAGPPTAGDPGLAWLYPYDQTVFPRGLLPPTLQFGGTPPDAVLLHVSFSSLDYQGFYGPSAPGQITLSPQLWTTITQSASTTDSVQVQITKISGGVVAGPITEHWIIAQGSLKGTVYYESRYSSPTDNGATMRIKPGASKPDVLLGNCNVCHYVSADGSTIVASLDIANVPITSGAYDLKNSVAPLSQMPNETYTFGALYKDGSFLMSCGSGTIPGIGNDGPVVSHLYDVPTGAQIPAPGWDGAITNGLMPTFSPDGKRIVFNHFDSGMGHSLALMDFDLPTHTFSNLIDIVMDPAHFLGWPAFTPDGEWVVYDADNRSDFATWGAVQASSGVDAKSDLQIAHLPSMTTASLDTLNGMLNGQYYLPFGETAEGHMNYDATLLPVAAGGYYWVVFTSRREYGNTINTADPYYNLNNNTPGALPWRKKLWVAALDIDSAEHPSTAAHDISHPAFYLDGQDLQTGNYRGFWALNPCQQNGIGCQSGDDCCSGFCRQVTGDAGVSVAADASLDAGPDAPASNVGGSDGGPEYVCVPPQACANEFEKCTTTADCCGAGQGQVCINGFCATPAQ